MPAWPGCYIRTDKGVRRLMNYELARGQGTPKAWMKDVYPRGQMVCHSVAVHVFEYVRTLLTRNEEVAALDPIPMNETASSSGKPPSTNSPFVWRPPDLSKDSAWTKKEPDGCGYRVSRARTNHQTGNEDLTPSPGELRLRRAPPIKTTIDMVGVPRGIVG
jgi:hypothetical protein